MRFFRFYIFITLLITSAIASKAADNDKIKLTPLGRLLVDGAAFISPDSQFVSGVAIPEIRLGLRGNYGNFTGKAEISVAYGKVALKDIYVQYDFNRSVYLRAGNVLRQFGLQSTYNASMKNTMNQPRSNSVFDLPRAIGVMSTWHDDRFLASGSLCAESKASVLTTNAMGKTGWGGTCRLVWRSHRNGEPIVQIGWSGAYLTPEYNTDTQLNHHSISLYGYFPSSVARIEAVGTVVDDARGYFKFTPELLLSKDRIALESQYYHGHVWRKNSLPGFDGYGAYAALRFLARGRAYKYNIPEARLDYPSGGSVELVLSYNYTCLTDRTPTIYGGRISDVSCTANWYINQYITWRLKAGYARSWDRGQMPSLEMTAFQTRLQFIF